MTKLIEIRCPNCNKKLCELEGRLSIKCPRCKKIVIVDTTKTAKTNESVSLHKSERTL